MSIICDGQFMNNVIDEFGEDIYLRVALSRTLSNEYATETVVWRQYKIKAIMNFYSADSEGVREGTYETGDITFMLETDYETLATPDNLIYYPSDGNWYEIRTLRKHNVGGTTYVLEVTVDKIGSIGTETLQTTLSSNALITT